MGRLELVELLEVLGKKHGKKPRRSKKRTELGKPRRNGKKSWRRDFEKLEKRKLEKEKPEKPKREKKMPGKRGKRQRRMLVKLRRRRTKLRRGRMKHKSEKGRGERKRLWRRSGETLKYLRRG
ncbi:MAG: hypothetical protein CMJ90_20035 [Planctomycetes bacterium]|nr:hypothetical protein [Planctomycetota bacterium]|tara:strand:- start:308 stop:676 length:369 start_codon:yes stop_codon:yes gene_type:complete